MPIEGLTSLKIDQSKNGATEAFKNHVEKVVGRNEEAENRLMGLGGMIDTVIKGKLHDWNNVNNKPSNLADMYHIDDINMMHRRVVDEYPEYAKDGSFRREIEDPLMSPYKSPKEDLMMKTSLVNQASSMKSKNNAQYIMHLVEGDGMSHSKFHLIKLWN